MKPDSIYQIPSQNMTVFYFCDVPRGHVVPEEGDVVDIEGEVYTVLYCEQLKNHWTPDRRPFQVVVDGLHYDKHMRLRDEA